MILGRATPDGVAADGDRGALRTLEILREEMRRVLALVGCSGVDDLAPDHLRRVDGTFDDGSA